MNEADDRRASEDGRAPAFGRCLDGREIWKTQAAERCSAACFFRSHVRSTARSAARPSWSCAAKRFTVFLQSMPSWLTVACARCLRASAPHAW